MILSLATVAIMLAGVYAFWHEGVLTAIATTVNILLAGLLAFGFFEPVADQLGPMFNNTLLQGYEDSICLIVLFSLPLLFLRWASNELMHMYINYHPVLQQAGSALFGLFAGYLLAGFLTCVAQTMPASEHFLQLEPRVEADSSGKAKHRFLPADRVWLALMHRASRTAFEWEDNPPFDADGSFELRYAHERRALTQ